MVIVEISLGCFRLQITGYAASRRQVKRGLIRERGERGECVPKSVNEISCGICFLRRLFRRALSSVEAQGRTHHGPCHLSADIDIARYINPGPGLLACGQTRFALASRHCSGIVFIIANDGSDLAIAIVNRHPNPQAGSLRLPQRQRRIHPNRVILGVHLQGTAYNDYPRLKLSDGLAPVFEARAGSRKSNPFHLSARLG